MTVPRLPPGLTAALGVTEQSAQTTSAPTLGGQAASPLGQPQPAGTASGVGVASFVLSLVGFLIRLLWIVGLVLSWRDVRRAKRENLPRGLALAGLVISSIGVGLLVVGLVAAMAIPLFLTGLPMTQGPRRATSATW